MVSKTYRIRLTKRQLLESLKKQDERIGEIRRSFQHLVYTHTPGIYLIQEKEFLELEEAIYPQLKGDS